MKTVAILGTPGFIPDPGRFGPEEMLAALGQNAGNLMFQYAATTLIKAPAIHVGKACIPYSDTAAIAAVDVIVVPMANHFRLGVDWTGFADFIERMGKPIIALGLGAQAPSVDYEREAVDALVADPQIQRFAARIREQAIFTTVRGPFTARVCEALGLGDIHVLGCPSLLVNRDPALGRAMATKLEQARTGKGRLRFGVAAAAPFEIREAGERREVERSLTRWAIRHEALYLQQSGGIATMTFCSGARSAVRPKAQEAIHRILAPGSAPADFVGWIDRRARFHTDARAWMAEVGGLDFVIGSRLHGVMAALGGGAAGVVISHDSRTSELERRMMLPNVTMDDVRSTGKLRNLLGKVRFDPDAFDQNRAETRAALARLMNDALGEGAMDAAI